MTTRADFDLARHPDMIARIEADYAAFRQLERKVMHELGSGYSVSGEFEKRSCPLCGADRPKLIFSKFAMDIVDCSDCGMRYSHGVMHENFDRSHYEQDITGSAAALDSLRRHPVYRELDLRRGRYITACLREAGLSNGATLLDIGSGHGALLEAALADGLRARGLEMSPVLAAACREKGLDVNCGVFPDALATGERQDAIVLLDVLEHFPEPRKALESLRSHLRPDGLLAIQVPNMESLQIALEGTESSNYCLGHWSYFTPGTLRRLLERNGFRILRLETYISEMHRIARHPAARIQAALASLGREGLRAESLDADAILANDLGYKLFAIGQPEN